MADADAQRPPTPQITSQAVGPTPEAVTRSASTLAAAASPQDNPVAANPGNDTQGQEISYAAFKTVHTLFVRATDITFTAGPDSSLRSLCKLGRGAFGLLSTVWAFEYTLGTYYARLAAEHLDPPDNLLLYGGLTAGLVPDGITFLSGLKSVVKGGGGPAFRRRRRSSWATRSCRLT